MSFWYDYFAAKQILDDRAATIKVGATSLDSRVSRVSAECLSSLKVIIDKSRGEVSLLEQDTIRDANSWQFSLSGDWGIAICHSLGIGKTKTYSPSFGFEVRGKFGEYFVLSKDKVDFIFINLEFGRRI